MRYRRGFMMLELLCAIAIACATTIFLTFAYGEHRRVALQEEVDLVYRTTLSLVYEATVTHRPTTLAFINDRSWMARDRVHAYTDGVRNGAPRDLYGPPGNPRKQIVHPITFPQGTITCFPDGTVSAGTLYLTDTHGVLCHALTARVGIPIPRKYVYDSSWKMRP